MCHDQPWWPLLARFLVLSASLLAWSTGSLSATITARLTATNPSVFIGPSGAAVSVRATTAAFTAVGDTNALYSFGVGTFAFKAPVAIDIPGVVSFVSNQTGSNVSTETNNAFPGIFRFDLRSIIGPGAQSVYMLDPAFGGYDFRSQLGPLPVVAHSSVNLPVGGMMSFGLPDGRSVLIGLRNAPGTLEVTVTEPLPVTADSPFVFVLVVFVIAMTAAMSRTLRR